MKDEKINGINITDGEVKKNNKGIIITVVIIIVLAIIGTIGYVIYDNYKTEQERLLQEAIATVAEVSNDNLIVEYNKEYTNQNIEVKLNTTSNDKIVYKFNEEDNYIEYVGNIVLEENSIIYVKYINAYGTYSNETYKIEITNIDKVQPEIIKKDVETTTATLTINAEAKDNIEVAKIEVSIDGENYNEVTNGSYTFEGLSEGTEYTVNIRVTDKTGNIKEDTVTGKTGVTKKATTSSSSSNKSSNKNSNSNKSNSSSSSKSNSGNSSSNETQTWEVNTYYGGDITDPDGKVGGYWEYGDVIETNIDTSTWTY